MLRSTPLEDSSEFGVVYPKPLFECRFLFLTPPPSTSKEIIKMAKYPTPHRIVCVSFLSRHNIQILSTSIPIDTPQFPLSSPLHLPIPFWQHTPRSQPAIGTSSKCDQNRVILNAITIIIISEDRQRYPGMVESFLRRCHHCRCSFIFNFFSTSSK